MKSTLGSGCPLHIGVMLFCAFDSVPLLGKAFRTRPDRQLAGRPDIFHLANFAAGMPQGECNDFDLE
jgi:hypothetical protein